MLHIVYNTTNDTLTKPPDVWGCKLYKTRPNISLNKKYWGNVIVTIKGNSFRIFSNFLVGMSHPSARLQRIGWLAYQYFKLRSMLYVLLVIEVLPRDKKLVCVT